MGSAACRVRTMTDAGRSCTQHRIRMLFFPRESFPTDRVRLNVLFGRELVQRGHEIDLVMQARNGAVPAGRHDWFGRSVLVGRTTDRQGMLGGITRVLLGLMHDLRSLSRAHRSSYDSIMVSDKYLLASIACVVARRRGMAFCFWLTYPYHQAQVTLAREGLAKSRTLARLRGHATEALLFRWILPRCDHVFVQSPRMARDFAAHNVPLTRMTPILTGIDLIELPAEPVVRTRSSRNPVTIGYLGTLARHRRLDVLVDTLDELGKRGVQARLLLIGDGASPVDRQLIEQRARDLGLESRLQITGLLPRAAALELIQTVDVCVSPFRPSPSLDVASPTKLVEYLALGLPVVANTHPEQSAVLRESRAGVCVPWGARHFARGIQWLSERSDAELAAMGRRGRAWVASSRSYASIGDSFERSYFDSLKQRAHDEIGRCHLPVREDERKEGPAQ